MRKSILHTSFYRVTFLTLLFAFIIPGIAMMPYELSDGTVKRVVIDAGHGGRDSGNLGTGRYKAKEKDISLEVALMVGNYIRENIAGVEVIYTRNTDKFVELRERCAMANRADADLFISIHCNAHTTRSAYGTETFVMGLTREKANLEVAKRENSVIFLEEDYEKNYEGFDPNDPQGAIVARLSSNAHLDQSIRLADLIQDQFRERVGRHDRGVKQSVLYVLDFTAMPSVLVELGFLTNHSEEDFLNTKKGKEYMASAIYRAFKQYKKEADELDRLNQLDEADPELEKPVEPETAEELSTAASSAAAQAPSIEANEFPVYKIQIATSSKQLAPTPANFSGLTGVAMYEDRGLYKFTYGEFESQEAAAGALKEVRDKGFADAFVIAWYKGERISLTKAAEIQ
jgi:N-acetylmuramoyl-L-alanine amidase